MLEARPIALLLALTALVGAACSSTASHPQSAAPSAGRPSTHDHSWRSLLDFGNGVQMETSLQTCEEVVLPGTEARVCPLAIQIDFKHGLAVMTELSYLKLHPIADVTPIEFTFHGISLLVADPDANPAGPFGYEVTLTPKTGFAWGTVRQVGDVTVVAVEIDPPQPGPGQEWRTAVPVGM